jgi:hypothetical protein
LVVICGRVIYFLGKDHLDVRSNGGGVTGIGDAVRLSGTDANAGQIGRGYSRWFIGEGVWT